MSEHTKEPWRLGRFTGPASYEEVRETVGNMDVVVDTDIGPYVLAACNVNFPEDARANARRIVACVNACAGIPNGNLESGGVLETVIGERNKLLAALKDLRPAFGAVGSRDIDVRAAQERIDALVAEVEAN